MKDNKVNYLIAFWAIIVIVLIFMLAGCGYSDSYSTIKGARGAAGRDGLNGSNGSDGANGADGQNGQDGTNGVNGLNGHSAAISEGIADSSVCPAGGYVINLGIDLNDDTILELEETTQTAILCNGVNGANGADGTSAPPTAFTPVALINPCGDALDVIDEVFIQLQDGTLLASFSDDWTGHNTRFAALTPGTYITSDGDKCIFTVNLDGSLGNEHH